MKRFIKPFLILCISIFPSHFLKMEREKVLYILPQSQIEVGEILTTRMSDEGTFWLSNKKFEVRNQKSAFAIVGLTKSATLPIHLMATKTSYDGLQPFREWKSQRLPVRRPPLAEANNLRLPTSVWKKVNDNEQIKRDRERMAAILSNYSSDDDIIECVVPPLVSKRVSKFASPRTLPNGKSYYHSGLDLRAFSPTPLAAMADGKVVFADFMLTPGNMVVLYHGRGIFSRYMHMSKIHVKEGERVPAGYKIGLSGGTGRVEAPHLHFEVIWKGNHANPENFLLQWAPICDQS